MSKAIAIGALLVAAMAPGVRADTPCDDIAAYLKDFASQHSDLRDTGGAEFLRSAIDLYDHENHTTGQPVEVLDSHRFESFAALDISIPETSVPEIFESCCERDIHDARPWSRFIALSQLEGSLHCADVAVFPLDAQGRPEGPAIKGGGLDICWSSTFHVTRVGKQAYATVVHNDAYGANLRYRIDLMSIDQESMTDDPPLCRVAIDYKPMHFVDSWLTDPAKGMAETDALRSRLESALLAAAAGQDAGSLLKPILDQEALGDQDFSNRNFVIPFVEQVNTPYVELDGEYLPIKIGERRYLLGIGTAMFGWREWPDLAFGVWSREGDTLIPVAGGFMGKEGLRPRIFVELP